MVDNRNNSRALAFSSPVISMHRIERFTVSLIIATVVLLSSLSVGCGGRKVLMEDELIEAELQDRGVDQLGMADFNQIRLIIGRGEDSTAAALLDNMPGRLRESPPWYYWKAVLATRALDYAEFRN